MVQRGPKGSANPVPGAIGSASSAPVPAGRRDAGGRHRAANNSGGEGGRAAASPLPPGAVPPAAPKPAPPAAEDVQPEEQSVRVQGRPYPQKTDLEYQKQVAKKLLDALDEDSLWHLARVLQSRGLIRALPGGLQAVPQVPRSDADAWGDGDADSLEVPHSTTLNLGAALAASAAKEVHPAAPGAAAPVSAAPAAPAPAPAAGTAGGAGAERGAAAELDKCGGNSSDNDKTDDSNATTLILRNLPPYYDQTTTQEWVDSKGYRDLYDFLLWFPAKKTSRLNTSSYAFVNFQNAHYAQRFRAEHHLSRFPPSDLDDDVGRKQQWPLSIALAKVQGFTENYIRFHHLTDDKSPTLCAPYFAPGATDRLSEDARAAAATAATSAPHLDHLQDGPCTTLIIRNLPYSVDNQDGARHWLDKAAFEGHYNFFLYLPAKRRRPESMIPGGPPQGLGYAFVNFKSTEMSVKCAEGLNGRALAHGDPMLNVVAARVQGLEECLSHFSSLCESGRMVPWVAPDVQWVRPPRQYQ